MEVPYDDDPALGHHGHEGRGGQYGRGIALVAAKYVQAERFRARFDDAGDQRVHGFFLAVRLVAGEEVHRIDPALLNLLKQLLGVHVGRLSACPRPYSSGTAHQRHESGYGNRDIQYIKVKPLMLSLNRTQGIVTWPAGTDAPQCRVSTGPRSETGWKNCTVYSIFR